MHGDYPIIHLSWNHQGNELAVFDSVGRISVFPLLLTLGDFATPKKCVIDTEDQLGVVVGLIWLNTDKPVLLSNSSALYTLTSMQHLFHETANKEDGQWRIYSSSHTSLGPYNPTSGMSALITVTKNGMVRLLIQGRDRSWQEAKTELDTYSVPRELLTHATIAAHKG